MPSSLQYVSNSSWLAGPVLLAASALLTSAVASATDSVAAQQWDTTLARGKTRTIDFTTEEGTWMTLDVSPDGRWIAFDLLGHIYRLPIGGGEAQCLTQDTGIAINQNPTISPDGKRIAFISERAGHHNLWVMDADGANPRLVLAEPHIMVSTPEWMPDGKHIVAQRIDTNTASGWFTEVTLGLWRYSVDGSAPVRLTAENPKRAESPAISADGKSLYYALFVATGNANAALIDLTRGDYRLMRQEMSNGETSSVSPLGGIAPQISPDGRWLAFARRIPDATVEYSGHPFTPANALWLRDLQSGAERVVLQPLDPDVAHGGTITAEVPQTFPGYSWMPDGKSIVIAQGGKIRRLDVNTGKVDTIAFRARVHRVISEQVRGTLRISDEPLSVRVTRWATRAPAGDRVVFQALGRLWIKDSARARPRRLTTAQGHDYEYAPAWSPDGKWVAFTTQDAERRGHLWKLAADGGTPVQLTSEPGEYWNPDWSADGRSLAVIRGPGIDAEIGPGATENHFVKVSADGGSQQTIGRLNSIVDRLPMLQFAADGRIYYPEHSRQRYTPPTISPPLTELVSIASSGGDRRVHAKLPYAEAVELSADGRWLAIERRADVYVMQLSDSKTPTLALDDFQRSSTNRVRYVGVGHYPRWRSADELEYDALSSHVLYTPASGKLTTTRMDLRVPRYAPKGRIALTGARIITLDQRKVIDRGDIVIEGARIACVGSCDPRGADKVIDISGTTVVPGFVDMHSPANNDYDYVSALSQGVTTSFDPSASRTEVSMAQRELLEVGQMVGPRLFGAGSNLRDDSNARDNFVRIDSFADARHEARKYAAFGAIALKNLSLQDAARRQMIAQAARAEGLRVTGHLHWASIASALSQAMEGYTGVQHFPLITPLYGDVTTFLGQANLTFNATLAIAGPVINREYFIQESEFWKDSKIRRFVPWKILMEHGPYAPRYRIVRPVSEYPFAHHSQGAADIVARGGHVAMATHGWGYAPHWEIFMQAAARGPLGALDAASLQGLEFLGAGADIGSITVGKLADLVVLDASPLEDVRNTRKIRVVMKGGVLYDANTMDEIWPAARTFAGVRWDRPLQ